MKFKIWILVCLLNFCVYKIIYAGALGSTSNSSLIKLIVPYSPGSGPDILARAISYHINFNSGIPVMIENIPGASGSIGTYKVVNSSARDIQILLAANAIEISYLESPLTAINPLKDLQPLALVAKTSLVLVINPKSTIYSLENLIAKAKTDPNTISIASPGAATPHAIAIKELEYAANIQLLHIPYKSSNQAISDLLGNQVTAMFLPLQSALPLIKENRLRALAQANSKRSQLMPNIPTFGELNLQDVDEDIWYGLFAPNSLPDKTTLELKKVLEAILLSDNFKKELPTGLEATEPSAKKLLKKIQDEKKHYQRFSAKKLSDFNKEFY